MVRIREVSKTFDQSFCHNDAIVLKYNATELMVYGEWHTKFARWISFPDQPIVPSTIQSTEPGLQYLAIADFRSRLNAKLCGDGKIPKPQRESQAGAACLPACKQENGFRYAVPETIGIYSREWWYRSVNELQELIFQIR